MTSQTLDFTVIIPTYNRPDCLKQCLQRLAQMDYPKDRFEVVVVDDGSQTPLQNVVSSIEHRLTIRLIRQVNSGPAKARNLGAKQSKSKHLVFTDDDCMPASDWLRQLARCFATHPNVLIGGKTLNALSDNLFSSASQILIDYLYQYYNQKPDKAEFFASNNIAVTRELFLNIGGFDSSYPMAAAEDRELCDRLLQFGQAMLYAPDARVYHAHHLTLKSFWRQHFNYGRGAFHFRIVRAQRRLEGIQIEPLSFYIGLLLYPFSKEVSLRAIALSGLLFLAQLANMLGFFVEKHRKIYAP